MELMDDSLTHFLESSPRPIPYHIQVNICHDITLALSFLHSNGIVHRDLSSNNVLLIGNVRA
jgi:serine/threonine-protein kinase TNNI3K